MVDLEAVRLAIDFNRLDPAAMKIDDLAMCQHTLGSLEVLVQQLKSRLAVV